MVIARGARTKELAKGIKKKERGDGHLIPRPASFFFSSNDLVLISVMIHRESHELERFREKGAQVEESCLFSILLLLSPFFKINTNETEGTIFILLAYFDGSIKMF